MARQNAGIDWERTMEETEANAEVAAKMTERAVAALAEALDHLRQQGKRLARMETMLKEAQQLRANQWHHCHPSSPRKPVAPRFLLSSVIAAFIAGAAFGVYFGSW